MKICVSGLWFFLAANAWCWKWWTFTWKWQKLLFFLFNITKTKPGPAPRRGAFRNCVPPNHCLWFPKREVCSPREDYASKESNKPAATGMQFGPWAPQKILLVPSQVWVKFSFRTKKLKGTPRLSLKFCAEDLCFSLSSRIYGQKAISLPLDSAVPRQEMNVPPWAKLAPQKLVKGQDEDRFLFFFFFFVYEGEIHLCPPQIFFLLPQSRYSGAGPEPCAPMPPKKRWFTE